MSFRRADVKIDEQVATSEEQARTDLTSMGQGPVSFGVQAQVSRGAYYGSRFWSSSTVGASTYLNAVTVEGVVAEIGRLYLIEWFLNISVPAGAAAAARSFAIAWVDADTVSIPSADQIVAPSYAHAAGASTITVTGGYHLVGDGRAGDISALVTLDVTGTQQLRVVDIGTA